MCTKAEEMGKKKVFVNQGNHCEDIVFARLRPKKTVISLKPFRERVGGEKCRWKQCNENGSNNTAGQSS